VRLVVAYGNPLRRDDGAAWRVAGALDGAPNLEVRYLHQLVPELAAAVAEAEVVVFVDAEVSGPPGGVAVRAVAPKEEDTGFGHVFGPGAVLELAERLAGAAPPAALVTIAVGDLGFGMELSPAVERALAPATEAVRSALVDLECRKRCAHPPYKH
jgi:hydrogenase maturation protease